jgi:hypothetical protein
MLAIQETLEDDGRRYGIDFGFNGKVAVSGSPSSSRTQVASLAPTFCLQTLGSFGGQPLIPQLHVQPIEIPILCLRC